MSLRVVLVGGGIIGLSLAYELSRRGAAVTLLERGDLGREASWAGAGILSPGNPEVTELPPLDRLRALSDPLLDDWSRQLREETGVDNGYRRCGALYVATDEAETVALQKAEERWTRCGVEFEVLDADALVSAEPNLSPRVRRACYVPREAQVRNPRHLRALALAAATRGARLETGSPAVGFETDGSVVTGVRTPRSTFRGDAHVITAGAWTGRLLKPLCPDRPVPAPVRGQIVLLEGTRTAPVRHVLWRGSRYVVPRPDGRVLLGSTMEDAGFVAHPTAKGVQGLLAFGAELVPDLAGLRFERAWAGLRPGSPDGLPDLGAVPGWGHLYVAAGHLRGGLELSTGTALVMSQLLLNETAAMPLDAFRPGRHEA